MQLKSIAIKTLAAFVIVICAMLYFSNNRADDNRIFLYASYIKETVDIDKKYNKIVFDMAENTKRGFTNYEYFINKINATHAKSQVSWRKIEILPLNIIWWPADACNHMRMKTLLEYTTLLTEALDKNDEDIIEKAIKYHEKFRRYLYRDGFYEVGVCKTLTSMAINIEDAFSLKN